MKTNTAALLLAAGLLAGCGLARQKAAEHYLGKARAAAQASDQASIEAGFAAANKALGYAPGSEQVIAVFETLAEASARAGFSGGQALHEAALRRALELDGLNWHAREALINFHAVRGDTAALDSMAAQAKALASAGEGAGVKYCALLAALAARAASVQWLESEAYLAMGKSPDAFFEKAAAFAAAAAEVASLKAEAERMSAADPSVKAAAPAALASAAEVSAADALRSPGTAASAAAFVSRAGSDPAFRKAVEMTVQGNASLGRKEYAQARAFYQGALQHLPSMLDARRQLAETDFQEGAALAAAGSGNKAAAPLLYKAYGEADAAIKSALGGDTPLPFTKPEKFLGELYALKAADLAALRAVEGRRLRNTARLEAEFKAALDEAVKLNPEGRLARELLERYSKEGF